MTTPPDNLDAEARELWTICCHVIGRECDLPTAMTALWIRRELAAESKFIRERGRMVAALHEIVRQCESGAWLDQRRTVLEIAKLALKGANS